MRKGEKRKKEKRKGKRATDLRHKQTDKQTNPTIILDCVFRDHTQRNL